MSLSKRSAEMLVDLVEIKLGYLEVSDREDAREFKALQAALRELQSMLGRKPQGAARIASSVASSVAESVTEPMMTRSTDPVTAIAPPTAPPPHLAALAHAR
ncbi:MAG: hypothetical protein U1E97_04440 [Alphaproteobacteria bacterium]